MTQGKGIKASFVVSPMVQITKACVEQKGHVMGCLSLDPNSISSLYLNFFLSIGLTYWEILALVLHLLYTSDDTALALLPVSAHNLDRVATIMHMIANMHSTYCQWASIASAGMTYSSNCKPLYNNSIGNFGSKEKTFLNCSSSWLLTTDLVENTPKIYVLRIRCNTSNLRYSYERSKA